MEQSVTLTDFSSSMGALSVSNAINRPEASNTARPIQPQSPIFITFSSSSQNEQSHEAAVLHHDPTVRDYFLYALATTARDTNVKDWGGFIHTLRTTFSHARSVGALWAEIESGDPSLSWLLAHPQTPQFTTSQVALPVRTIRPISKFSLTKITCYQQSFKHVLPPMECR